MNKEIKDLMDSKPNKYFKWYFNICEYRKNNFPKEYSEFHHIYPKSIFGENDEIVPLTLKEHYICHLLLWNGLRQEFGTENFATRKMCFAFVMMNNTRNHEKIDSSNQFALIRTALRERGCEEETKLKISKAFNTDEQRQIKSKTHKGKIVSEETRRKLSESHKNQKPSEEMKKHLSIINSGENHPQFGTKHSDETKKKMSKPRSEQAKLNMKLAAQKRIEKLKEEGKPLAWNSGLKLNKT